MGKHEHFKVKGLWNFLVEAEIHAVPNTWEKWISIIWEKHGKTQTFRIYGFLKNFGLRRNPYNSRNMGKVNFHNMGKVWGEKTFQIFSNILGKAEIQVFLKFFG